jgi:hypothetical protein
MSKGKKASPGDTMIAANGYHYTRTPEKWRLTHHLVAEREILHRELAKDERVVFIDGDRTNIVASNIRVNKKQVASGGNKYHQKIDRFEEMLTEFVEVQQDKAQALQDLRDMFNEVRFKYDFGRI